MDWNKFRQIKTDIKLGWEIEYEGDIYVVLVRYPTFEEACRGETKERLVVSVTGERKFIN